MELCSRSLQVADRPLVDSALLGSTVVLCCQSTKAWVLFPLQRNAWSSVVHVLRQSTDWLNFWFFYVKRWITDPEIDSRSRNTFYCPSFLTVTCSWRRLRSI